MFNISFFNWLVFFLKKKFIFVNSLIYTYAHTYFGEKEKRKGLFISIYMQFNGYRNVLYQST
jgi:hypothetical protein